MIEIHGIYSTLHDQGPAVHTNPNYIPLLEGDKGVDFACNVSFCSSDVLIAFFLACPLSLIL